LLPGAVVGLPVPSAMILPGGLLGTLLRCGALRWLLPLRRRLLGVLLRCRLLPLRRRLLGVLLRCRLLPLRRRLLGVLLRCRLLPPRWRLLGVLLRRRPLLLRWLLLGVLLRLTRLTLLVALPLILRRGWSGHSKRQRKDCRCDDEFCIHRSFL